MSPPHLVAQTADTHRKPGPHIALVAATQKSGSRAIQPPESHSQQNQPSGLFPSLDILRGFAAVSVVVYHVIYFFSWTSFPSTFPFGWFRSGDLSVDLFFVISGLVITLSLLRGVERHPGNYARIYIRRRFARIAPLHYLTCAAYIAIVVPVLMTVPDFRTTVVRYLTFTQNLSPSTFGLINGPNWTLGIEMQFYFLLLLAAPLLKRARPLSVLLTLIAASWIYRGSMFTLFHGQKTGWLDTTWFSINQLPGMLDEFGFGIALALVFHQDRAGKFRRFLHATCWLWPVAAAGLLTFTLNLYFTSFSYWATRSTIIFYRTLLGASWFVLILSACAINDRWFLRVTTPLRYLGTISYGIYLWHTLVITLIKPHFVGSPAQALVATLTLTIALAALSWHLIESPILNRLGKAKSD